MLVWSAATIRLLGDERLSKILLVTGASRGIDAATARLAADQGYDVCVNYASKADEAEAVADNVRSKVQRAITVQADVGNEADVSRLFQACDAELGRLTAFFNNAGVVDVVTRLEEMSEASIDRMMRINVIGSFMRARRFCACQPSMEALEAPLSTCHRPQPASEERMGCSTTVPQKGRSTPLRRGLPKRWAARGSA